MKLSGRVLWLTEDASLLARQLGGETLEASAARHPPLRYGINTDLMIDGAACTLGYTPEILGPHFLEGLAGRGKVRAGGFQVVVGGDAYGSGSSREVAVVAHQGAGVELVVAKSFQRIFQENLVYAGLPFTTDLRVVDRLLAGEAVDLSRFLEMLPPFFRAVAEAGGLLAYGTRLLSGEVGLPYPLDAARRPMTCAEKIIARQVYRGPGQGLGATAVRPGDQVLCAAGFRGLHEYTAGMVMALYEEAWGDEPVHAPETAACFEDHFVLLDEPTVPLPVKSRRLEPARALAREMVEACDRHGIRLHGPGRAGAAGICHRVVVEAYALPGSLVVLTDSHTPTAGVLNAFAFGIGSTAMAFALRTGLVPVTVPKTVRVEVEGEPSGFLSPKDLILHVIGDPYFREERWREAPTDTCVLELAGPGLEHWDVDELSVLTNMTVEGGLMTGIVTPCDRLRRFLEARRPDVDIGPLFVEPDPGAEYARILHVKLEDVPLTIATPGDSRNRAPLSAYEGTPIHNVVIASCTGGSLQDLRAAARVLGGRRVAPGVRVTVTPASLEVAEAAKAEGLTARFVELGAVVTEPGCGSCIGNGPGIPGPGETTASTTNRNFEGRMGAPGPVYLVSPAVAAASAVTGRLTDPRRLPPT